MIQQILTLQDGSGLKITVSENCEVESLRVSDATTIGWGLIKEGTEDNDTTIKLVLNDYIKINNEKNCKTY